jgi:hypothetical protein
MMDSEQFPGKLILQRKSQCQQNIYRTSSSWNYRYPKHITRNNIVITILIFSTDFCYYCTILPFRLSLGKSSNSVSNLNGSSAIGCKWTKKYWIKMTFYTYIIFISTWLKIKAKKLVGSCIHNKIIQYLKIWNLYTIKFL